MWDFPYNYRQNASYHAENKHEQHMQLCLINWRGVSYLTNCN